MTGQERLSRNPESIETDGPLGWFDTAQSATDDDMDHAETEELICAAGFTYCDYNDGSGDDGFPAFALIRIDGQWRAVCAVHAQAAAAGEIERNYEPVAGSPVHEDEPSEVERLRARIGSALTWIDRYDVKNDGLTIILSSIKDSLTGVRCVDATLGAPVGSDQFRVGESS